MMRSKIFRQWLCAIGFTVACATFNVNAQNVVLPRQQAVDTLIAELGLFGDVLAWSLYQDYGYGPGFEGVLPAGTQIRPYNLDSPSYPGNVVTLSAPSYFFFVNDEPDSLFNHGVRFVYMAATTMNPNLANGSITVQTQGWWPMVTVPGMAEAEWVGPDGQTGQPASAFNPEGLVFGSNVFTKNAIVEEPLETQGPIIDGKRAGAKSCAIIITGDTTTRSFQGDADAFERELGNRGVPAGRIQKKKGAKEQDLKDMVANACKADPKCDKIYVYIGAHGNENGISLADGTLTWEELCKILEPLGTKGVPVCLWVQSCGSGAFIDMILPKFPSGITVVTSAGKGKCSKGGNVPGTGWISYLTYVFIQCWNDDTADKDGDGKVSWAEAFAWVCEGDNSKVTSTAGERDAKDPDPEINGLATKIKRWQGPVSGYWYVDAKRDTDKDGKYDRCNWSIDYDCDGNIDVLYMDVDSDEDGNDDAKTCLRDNGDDGSWDTKYEFEDTDDDGDWEKITCHNFDKTTGEWKQIAQATPRSQNSFLASTNSGLSDGGDMVMLHAVDVYWENPEVTVFIGSEAQDVQLLDPFTIMAMTGGYAPSTQDILVVDFDPLSPTYGIDQLKDGFTYNPILSVDRVSPAMGDCFGGDEITITGELFDPAAMVMIDGQQATTAWIDENTLMAITPPGMNCGAASDVTVLNPPYDGSNGMATLEGAFHYDAMPDMNPPTILCPDPIILMCDEGGMAYLPPTFTATASDDSGVVTVYRNQAGGLTEGDHIITFEAVDPSGNRSTCDTLVTVEMRLGNQNPDGLKAKDR